MRTTRRNFIRNAGLALAGAPFLVGARGAAVGRPNVLVVMTDDQPVGSLRFMPGVRRFFDGGSGGLDLTEGAYGECALCAPSRTSFLTGRYPHNHGTFGNEGAYAEYRKGSFANEDLLARLDRVGYRVGFFGKFTNNYVETDEYPRGHRWVHPHAERWSAIVGIQNDATRYRVNNDGVVTEETEDHTTYFGSRAERFVRAQGGSRSPWYAQVNFTDPHSPYTPPPTDAHDFDGARPNNPATRETDFSDKSSYWQRQRKVSPEEAQRRWEGTLEEGHQTDGWFSRLVSALADTNQLRNTIVIFVSDNGFLFGEHGGLSEKSRPYEHSIRVPLLVKGPAIPTRERVDAAFGSATPLVSRIDLTRTILAAAQANSVGGMDGRDLRELAGGNWRRRVFAEQPGENRQMGWTMVREGDTKLVRFDHENAFELYDLARDRHELRSLARDPLHAGAIDALYARLGAFRTSSGNAIRALEEAP